MKRKTDNVRLVIRLPRELSKQIAASARTSSISLNKEIIARLESSFIGMPEAVLMMTFGATPATGLIGAYQLGRLRLQDNDVLLIKKRLIQWVDEFNEAIKGVD